MLRIFFSGLLLSFSLIANAQDYTIGLTGKGLVQINPGQVGHFVETLNNDGLAISDVIELNNTDWKRYKNKIPNLGYDTNAHWFKFSLKNKGKESIWYLVFEYPLVSSMDVFFVKGKSVLDVFQVGDRFEFAARPVEHRDYVFPFLIQELEQIEVYIRIETGYAIQAPVSLATPETFWELESKSAIIHGMFFGFLLLVIFYNLFLFSATRDMAYFYFVMFTLFVGMFQAAQQGFGYQYFWSTNIWWQHRVVSATSSLSCFFGALFLQAFLNMPSKLPRLNRCLNVLLVAALLLLAGTLFFEQHYVQVANNILGGIDALLVFFVGFYGWKKGIEQSRFFVFASLIFIVSITVFIGNKLGFFPRTFWTEYGLHIGAVAAFSLMSFALISRINSSRLQQEKLLQEAKAFEDMTRLANDRALEVERSGKQRLERNMRARTEQLKNALKELSLANRQIEEISSVDSLTGVKSLVYFAEKVSEEWKRGGREKNSLSLLLVSIDQFELIGDRYGYVAAEEILKIASSAVRKCVTRPADMVGRVGAAEFGVLMPNTRIQGAEHVANAIYDNVASKPLNIGICSMSVKVSIVVLSRLPNTDVNGEQFLEEAKERLISISENGGNRIVYFDGDKAY